MGNEVDNNKFTWVIKNISSLGSEKIYSDEFVIGGCKWRLKAYPKGNNNNNAAGNNFSLYLVVADAKYLHLGWRRHAKFSLTVVNQFSENLSQVKEAENWFEKKEPNWGYTRLIKNGKLKSKNGGFLVNGEVKIVVEVDVLDVIGELDVPEETEVATPPLKKIKLEETSSVNQSIDVNGFHVLPSQVDFVKRIFENHPDVALEVHTKNLLLKTAYMNVLLRLTETLCRSPREISNYDLADAYDSLRSLKDVGFKLDWLEKKLDEVPEKKEKEEAIEARMREIEQELKDLKAKASVARAPLKFDDIFS